MRHVVAREHRDVGAPLALAKVLEPREEALAAHEQLQGVNSIGQKNISEVFGPVFWPKLGQVLPVSISLPWPANRPIFNLTSWANFRAYVWAIKPIEFTFSVSKRDFKQLTYAS